MKKTILLLICITLMTLGLWGCSSVPAPKELSVGSDATVENISNESINNESINNESVSNESISSPIDWDSLGIIFHAPVELKDGDILPDATVYPEGTVYFGEVSISSMEDAIAFLKKYNLQQEGSYTVNFVTPKYYGSILYIADDDLYCLSKSTNDCMEEYTYGKDGLVSFDQWISDKMANTEPVVLVHGVKIDSTTVYIDTSITDISENQSIGDFFKLIEEYFGERDPDTSYTFVAGEDTFTVSKMQSSDGHKVLANVSNESGGRSEHHFEYTESQKLIQHIETAYDESGNAKYRIWEKDGDAEKKEWFDDGVFVRNTTKNGTTTVVKQKDSLPIYYYKNNWKEVFLTYNGSGMLIGYKAISLKDGEVYDWVLDGNGLEPENFVSVTITKNGSSKTYVGKNEIPWGAAIFYPPKSNSSYE